ncbi:hypothetical protein ACLOJK_038087 [Asimina triloba]
MSPAAEAVVVTTIPNAISSHPYLCSSIVGIGPSTPVHPLRPYPMQALAAISVRCLPTTGDLHQRPSASMIGCIKRSASADLRSDNGESHLRPAAAVFDQQLNLPELKKTRTNDKTHRMSTSTNVVWLWQSCERNGKTEPLTKVDRLPDDRRRRGRRPQPTSAFSTVSPHRYRRRPASDRGGCNDPSDRNKSVNGALTGASVCRQ